MARDTAFSHLHIASPCHEDSQDSNNNEMMKRPLIATTRSSEDAQAKEQQDKGLIYQVFLLGSAIGFLLEVIMGFATRCTILKIWGQNPTFSGSLSLLSYWILTLCGQVSVVIYIYFCFWLVVHHTRSKSGYMYLLRKKLDQDVDAPAGSNSIWSAPPSRLFVVRVYFLFGVTIGTYSVSTIVYLYMGVAPDRSIMALPYNVVDCALFWLALKYFECVQKTRGEEQAEQEGAEALYSPPR
jgi:hypothetical protein